MSRLPPIHYKFPNVVVGWRTEAVEFAAKNNYHLIVNCDERPFFFTFREDDIEHPWYKGIFHLGMQSLLPIPFEIQTISMEGDTLKVITNRNTKVMISFENLYLFDTENIMGMPIEQEIEDYFVYDHFNLRKGSKQEEEFHLIFKDSFVQEAKFVPSHIKKSPEERSYKDIITKSLIPGNEIENFDFSSTIIKVFLERELLAKNIRAIYSDSRGYKRKLTVEHKYRLANKNRFNVRIYDDLDSRIKIYANN